MGSQSQTRVNDFHFTSCIYLFKSFSSLFTQNRDYYYMIHFLFKVLIIKAHFIDLCYRNGLNAARFLPSYTVIISNIAFSLMVSLAYDHNEGWWKGMKQFLPAKSVEHEETPVRYSSSEVNHLSPREVTTMLQTDSAGNYSTARAQGETAVLAAKCFGIYSIFYLFHV